MKITHIKLTRKKDRTQLTAEVHFNGKIEKLYIAVAGTLDYSFNDATPFLAAGLYPAMKKSEDIYIDGTVSEKVLMGIHQIMDIVDGWKIGLHTIRIHSKQTVKDTKNLPKKALFFSGGVDSFYTILTQNKRRKRISTFIFVHGMDISLQDTKLYKLTLNNIEKVAGTMGITVVTVRTNIREFTGKYVKWDFAHGPIIASIALALPNNFNEIFISGGMHINHMRPFGSHPLIDPLWSGEKTIINHYGSYIDRLGKIREEISKSKLALSVLRVCWRNKNTLYNCCECEKCLRTMLSLHTSGALKYCPTFNKPIDLNILSNLYVVKNHIRYFTENLVELQKSNRDKALINAIETCIAKNEHRPFFNSIDIELRRFVSETDEQYFGGKIFKFAVNKGLV